MSKCFRSAQVIQSRRWVHKTNGRRASIYGAAPWSGGPGDTAADWEVKAENYALECISHRGVMTIQGLQYAPYKLVTVAEAFAHGEKIANEVTIHPSLQEAA